MTDQTLVDQAVVSPVNVQEFSKKVKEKYPEYKDVDDLTLAQKIVEKYPEYKDRVQFDPEPEAEPQAQSEQPLIYMQKELRQKLPENYTGEQNSVLPSMSIQDATKAVIQQNDPEARLYSGKVDKAPTSNFTPENIEQGKILETQFSDLYNSLNVEYGKDDLKEVIQNTTKELYKKGLDYAHAVANGDAKGAVRLWNGLSTIDLENLITVGVKGMSQDVDIYKASQRYSEGKATTEDKNLLVAKAMLDEVSSLAQNDRMTSVGTGLSDMAPWLAQFALTGGIGATATKATEKLLLTQLGKSMLAKGAAKVGGVIAGTTAQTLAQVPNMVGGTAQRMTDQYQLKDGNLLTVKQGEGGGEAFAKTFGNNFLEVVSERAVGDGVTTAWTNAMNKLVASPKLGKTYAADIVNWSRTNKIWKTTNKSLGLHSPITENIEEAFTGLTQPIVTADGWDNTKKEIGDYFTQENLTRTFVTTVLMGSGMGLVQTPSSIIHSSKSNIGKQYTNNFDLEQVDLWIGATGGKTVDERTKAFQALWNESIDRGATKKELNGMMHYYQDYVSDLENYGNVQDKIELPKPITTATIEGQQFTVNNPEDLGIEGKPIFAKDAEGNIKAVPGHKVTDFVTQTQGEIDQAQQAAADQQALMNGILDPNAQVVNDENYEEENTRIVDFSNGQSKIIYNGKEVVANDENEKDEILNSINDYQKLPEPKVLTEPTDGLFSEPTAPAEKKITTQPIGNTQIDFIENEDFDEVVPTDKMPLEKALPILEKKFKDHPKVVVVAEKVQVEVPGKVIKGETKWDDDVVEPSTTKTVIKSIKIVPKAVIARQKQADTDILLDFIDEFNATPQSREDKQKAGEIEAIAKQLGYQTDRNAMNQIYLFDASGDIKRSNVSKNANNENQNIEKVPEISDQNAVDQFDTLFETENNSKINKLQNEDSEKVIQPVAGNVAENREDTPQAEQGERNEEGLEENVIENIISTGQPATVSKTADPVAESGTLINETTKAELTEEQGITANNNFGIIPKPVKTPVKKSNSIAGKAKEVEVAESDIHGLVLQYFVNGGIVNPDEVLRMFRNAKSERDYRKSYADQQGQTVAQIAHDIWQSLPENIQGGLGEMDVYNAVEGVIREYNTPTLMAQVLLKKYSLDPNQGYSEEWLNNQIKIEEEERLAELEVWTNDLVQLEINGQLPTESERNELFLTDNTEENGKEYESPRGIDPHRPVNPEGNDQIGQNVQGSEPGVQGENESEVSQTERFGLKPTETLQDLADNINSILEQYSGRDMAAVQVETYMNEFKPLGLQYLAENGIKTRDELKAHLAKLQTKVREGKGKERQDDRMKFQEVKAQQNVDAIIDMALKADAEMQKQIEESEVKPPLSDVLEAGKKAREEKKPERTIEDLKNDKSVFWHGSPSGDMRGGAYGLHIGTHEAAKQALESRIGVKADGTDWDGTEEYGKTLLAGKKTLSKPENKNKNTGYNAGRDVPENDYYPKERTEKATYGDRSIVSENAKPNIQPVKIIGEMSNTPSTPHEDFKANGYMKAAITKGNAKRGYFYRNEGEDAGSISAVLPGLNHIALVPVEKQSTPLPEEKPVQAEEAEKQSVKKPLDEVLKEGKEIVEEKPKEVIEDFGEKIEGARKDQIKKYFDKINLNGKILSTIFPKPDIKALLESGLSVKDVAGIKVAHEFATQDKKKGERVIKFYAAYAKNILAESINLEYKNEGYVFTDYGKSQIELRTKAYQDVHDKLGSDYLALNLTKVNISEPDKSGRTTYFSNGEPIAASDVNYIVRYYVNTQKYFATLLEAIDYFTEQVKANTKIDQVVYKRKLNIYYDKRVKGEFYIGYPSKGDVIKLKEGFKASREAFEALKNPEILSDLQTMLERILAENRQASKPAVRLKYSNETARERVGKDWRDGKDIGSKELAETFGFRAIEFGNWVNQKERQVFVNNTYDSLMDLAQLLNISPKAISLAGNLGLTFGSRGSGKAAAHYEPGRKIINLTKTQGLGSLAHEWWHGVDNYFADFKTALNGMKSASAQEYSPESRDEIKKSFDELYKAVNNYSYKQRAKNLDGTRNVEYFALPYEMSARAFENFMLNRLAQSGQVNDFIVNFISNEDWNGEANKYPYPKAEESVEINEAFQQLFDVIQEKEENGNNVMFRIIGETGAADLSNRPNVVKALTKISDELGVPVHIIASSEIPGNINNEIKRRVSKGERIKAFHSNGKVYIISDAINSVSDAIKSYLHETVIHKGLRQTFAQADKTSIIGKQFAKLDDLLSDVYDSMSRSQKIEIAEKYAPGLYENGQIKHVPTLEEKALIAEEYLAKVAEDLSIYDAPTLSKWQQFINRLSQIVRKAFRLTSNQFTENDLLDIVRESRERLKSKAEGKTDDETRFRVTEENLSLGDKPNDMDIESKFIPENINIEKLREVEINKTKADILSFERQITSDNDLLKNTTLDFDKYIKNFRKGEEIPRVIERDGIPFKYESQFFDNSKQRITAEYRNYKTINESKKTIENRIYRYKQKLNDSQTKLNNLTSGINDMELSRSEANRVLNNRRDSFALNYANDTTILNSIAKKIQSRIGGERHTSKSKKTEYIISNNVKIRISDHASRSEQDGGLKSDNFRPVEYDQEDINIVFGRQKDGTFIVSINGNNYDFAEYNINSKPDIIDFVVLKTKTELSKLESNQPTNTILINGTPRPTLNSNGKPIAATEEGIRNFYEWFGDSKVVDAEGRPLVVYHGSPLGGITEFNRSKSSTVSSGLKEQGLYFGTNEKLAKMYANGRELSKSVQDEIKNKIADLYELQNETRNNRDFNEIEQSIKELRSKLNGEVYSVYLKIPKLFTFDAEGQDGSYGWASLHVPAGYKTAWGRDAIEVLNGINKAAYGTEVVDGILAKNISDIHSYGSDSEKVKELTGDVYLLFDGNPNNVKSATGNNGSFSPESNDIRFQIVKDEALNQLKEDLDKITTLGRYATELKELEDSKVGKKVAERKVIVKQISGYKQGYRAGVAEKRLTLQVIQRNITKYANENMNYDDATRYEITQLLTALNNANTPATISNAFDKIDELASKGLKRKLLSNIARILKNATPKLQSGKPVGKLAPETYKTLTKIKEIASMTTEQYDNYLELIADDDIESIALASMFGNIKEKSINDLFEALRVAIEITKEGRTWYNDKIEALKKRHKELVEKAVDDITGGKGIQSTQDIRSQKGNVDKSSYFKEFLGKNQSFEWLLDLISNNKKERTGWGFMQDHFGDLASKSENAESKGLRETIELVNKKAFEIFGKEKSALAKVFGENSRMVDKTGVTFATNEGRKEMGLSQNEAYKRWMEMNDPTLKPTFEKMGWDEQSLQELESFIDPKVLAWAKWQINEFFPEYYKKVNEVYKSMYFVDLPFNPSYSGHLKREKTSVGDKEDTMLRPDTLIGTVANSSLKSRIRNVRDIMLQDGDQTLAKHVAEMEHFMAWAETIREIRAVLSNDQVQDAIKKEHGNNIRTVLNERINSLVRGGVDRGEVNYLVDKIRTNFVTSALGVNLSLTPKQMTAIFSYLNDITIMDYIKGAAEFFANPRQAIEILSQSEFIKRRYKKGWTHEIEAAMKKNNPNTLAGTKSTINSIRDALMLPVMLGDKFAVYAGYPVYAKFLREFKRDNPAASGQVAHDFALNKFERVTKRTQQSSDVSDTSRFQETSIGKVFMMFKNAQQQYFRYEMAAINNMIKGRGDQVENAKIIFVTHVVLPVVFQMVANWFTDEDDETENKRLLRAALLGPIDGLMIAGDIVGFGLEKMMGERWSYSASPMLDVTQDLGNSITQMVKYINEPYPEKQAEELQKALDFAIKFTSSTMTGIPYEPVKKLYNKVTGEEKRTLKEEDAREIISKADEYLKFVRESAKRKDTELHSKLMSDKNTLAAVSALVISDSDAGKMSYDSKISKLKKYIKYWKTQDTDEGKRNVEKYETMLETTYDEILEKYSDIEFPSSYKLNK